MSHELSIKAKTVTLRQGQSLAKVIPVPQGRTTDAVIQELTRYYTESGPDYQDWSSNYHMHFGFYRWGLNPLRRERMLEEMSRQVLLRLGIDATDGARLLDMGCGLGATARYAAAVFPTAHITGVTIVPWQVEQARRVTGQANLSKQIRIVKADYTNTFFTTNKFDGIYAIESMCYASGLAKQDFVAEAFRLLKPGQKLVVADGFYKHTRPMNRLLKFCADASCRFWALETYAGLEAYIEQLKQAGFRDIKIEEKSWNLVPSLLFVPWVATKFLFKEILIRRSHMSRVRWGHVYAPFLGIVLGLARKRFGYYLITATK